MRAANEIVAARKPKPRMRTRPLSVLIIEDNADARELLADLLRSWGSRVAVAGTGEAGLEAIHARHFDVVFSDLGLPRIDGLEVCRRVRRDIENAPLMVALTARGAPCDRECTTEAGFDMHVVKPVNAATLIEILNSVGD
jgi:CheY-like chemotaxis protein